MVSALRAGRQAAIERVSRPQRVHLVGVGVVTAIIALIFSVYSLTLYYTFKTSAYDLTIFDQAVRSYAHFHLGRSPLKGVHNGFGPNFSVLGDHFSPIIALLAPLYWIHNSPSTLLVAQAVLFALAIPSLWLFTRRAFGGGRKATIAAYFVAVAYGLSWPLIAAVAFDFHEVAFAPMLTMIAIERFQAGRLRSALIALAFLLLVKEDMGLFIAGLGVWLILTRDRMVPRQYLVALGMIVVGVCWTAVATYLFIPAFGGMGDYYWAYDNLGKNVPGVVQHVVAHPRSSLETLIKPARKLRTYRDLLAPFLFLPLLSPIVIAIIPLLLERMLGAKFPNWWGTGFQYNAYLVIPLACAAVDGAARLDRWVSRAYAALFGRSASTAAGTPAGTGGPAAGAATRRPVTPRPVTPWPVTPWPVTPGPADQGGRHQGGRHRGRRHQGRRRAPRAAEAVDKRLGLAGAGRVHDPRGAGLHPPDPAEAGLPLQLLPPQRPGECGRRGRRPRPQRRLGPGHPVPGPAAGRARLRPALGRRRAASAPAAPVCGGQPDPAPVHLLRPHRAARQRAPV